MKAVIRLKPVGRASYSIVVQENKSFYTAPYLAKLGLLSLRSNVIYVELSFKELSIWLRQGAIFTNKRLLRVIRGFYGKN